VAFFDQFALVHLGGWRNPQSRLLPSSLAAARK
jgi:hypothetical protein